MIGASPFPSARELIAERFAAPRGHDDHGIPSGQEGADDLLQCLPEPGEVKPLAQNLKGQKKSDGSEWPVDGGNKRREPFCPRQFN